jgi:peptide/nickel transport system substrate-binding protein
MQSATTSRVAALLAMALGTVLLAGCGRDPNRPVVIASVSDVSSLDPHLLDVNHPTGSVIWSLFDSLVRRGADGADLPRLAASWERRDDFTWRFHLRRGVKFQDGSVFTAEDVKFSVDRMGNSPFNTLTQLWPQTTLKEARVIDDYTVDLVTEKPSVTLLYWLEEAFIVPKTYYGSHDMAYVNAHPLRLDG